TTKKGGHFTRNFHKAITGQEVTTQQRYEYDHAGRIKNIFHKTNALAEVNIASYEYNVLGQMVDKKLHNINSSTFLQSVDYRYNIRGWLASINNSTLDANEQNDDTNDFFGMELIHNQTDGSINNSPAFNGNISAIKWKGIGDSNGQENQKVYTYEYDKSNRLLQAAYKKRGTTGWNKELNNLNETITYDDNGNIKTLSRNTYKHTITTTSGIPFGNYESISMDNLTYTYSSTMGNRLEKVEDAVAGNNGFINSANSTIEYTYSNNGSVTSDLNKGIQTIVYNDLGKPQTITFTDGRTINYLYSGNGLKLKTTTVVAGQTTIQDYCENFIYVNQNLSFFGIPEGRVVKKGNNYEYQYSIADHQGNTRVVFTSAPASTFSATANFESPTADATEFLNIPTSSPYLVSFTAANNTPAGIKVVRLNQNFNVGPAKSLKVYPGDKVEMEVWCYHENSTGWGNTAISTSAFIAQLAGAFGGVSGASGESGRIYSGVNEAYGGGATGTQANGDTNPSAYLNYIVFDENYKFLKMNYIAVPASAFYNKQKISLPAVDIQKTGYVFVYLSYNAQSNNYVNFDDFKITHTKTQVIQYNEYYPFGLQANSSWTKDGESNAYLYNGGSELNNTTSYYETTFRSYDQTLGRFMQIDPLANSFANQTSYNFANNDPVYWNDPTGACPECTPNGVSDAYERRMAWLYAQGAIPFEEYGPGSQGHFMLEYEAYLRDLTRRAESGDQEAIELREQYAQILGVPFTGHLDLFSYTEGGWITGFKSFHFLDGTLVGTTTYAISNIGVTFFNSGVGKMGNNTNPINTKQTQGGSLNNSGLNNYPNESMWLKTFSTIFGIAQGVANIVEHGKVKPKYTGPNEWAADKAVSKKIGTTLGFANIGVT
ncbi:MAG: RHS repeat-associated core domain-containing protein, partial [Chryseotalea sp.]